MAKKLTINRKGICTANHKSNNQCKDVGHGKYEYLVSVTVGDKLDENGFIIDHIELHKIVECVFKKGVSSCEEIGLKIIDAVAKATKKHGCELKQVYVKIQPMMPEGSSEEAKAFMEISENY